jgi:tyrosyl-DNA phosphodiesterase 2
MIYLGGPRVNRALSAFDHASHRWAAIPLRDPHASINSDQRPSRPRPANAHHVGLRQTLSLTSWNIYVSHLWRLERFRLLFDHILEGPKRPDIIHLQEVTSIVRQSLLSDSRVRSDFLVTDAEDDAAFKGFPFATMTLLSNKRFGSASLTEKDRGGAKGEGEKGSKLVPNSVFRKEFSQQV